MLILIYMLGFGLKLCMNKFDCKLKYHDVYCCYLMGTVPHRNKFYVHVCVRERGKDILNNVYLSPCCVGVSNIPHLWMCVLFDFYLVTIAGEHKLRVDSNYQETWRIIEGFLFR